MERTAALPRARRFLRCTSDTCRSKAERVWAGWALKACHAASSPAQCIAAYLVLLVGLAVANSPGQLGGAQPVVVEGLALLVLQGVHEEEAVSNAKV